MTAPEEQTDDHTDGGTREEPEAPSKSQLKRDMAALRDLGQRLLEVPDATLAALPYDAVCTAPPTGQGMACEAAEECEGFEASYCEALFINACLVDECADMLQSGFVMLEKFGIDRR